MNSLLDDHEAGRDTLPHRLSSRPSLSDDISEEPARELTLGTTTILALFFGLALLCAAFFAFGYSLGGRHVPAAAAIAATSPAPAPDHVQDHLQAAVKPAPGSPVTPVARTTQPTSTEGLPAPPPTVIVKPVITRAAADPTPAEPPVTAAPAPGAIVQVAAVSHQEDAELIATTLKRRGYAVVVRNEPQDKLFHLQLGPFPTKKDAEAMRQRLLADGFNAYVK